jgi:hypothetical protein
MSGLRSSGAGLTELTRRFGGTVAATVVVKRLQLLMRFLKANTVHADAYSWKLLRSTVWRARKSTMFGRRCLGVVAIQGIKRSRITAVEAFAFVIGGWISVTFLPTWATPPPV